MNPLNAICRIAPLLCFSLVAGLASAAGLEVTPSVCDFGEVGPVTSNERTLCVSNAGPSVVRISRVQACCGAMAALSQTVLAPSATAELKVSVATGAQAGPFRKTVTVFSDAPGQPLITLPLTGSVRSAVPVVLGDTVVLKDTKPVVEHPSSHSETSSGRTLPLTVLAVVAAGIVDGFNPCSFAIMISLAGILAIGGRRRRARVLGGLSFCFGSFVTYMLMGLGLMQALRALEGLRLVHVAMMTALSVALFILSVLSFRDAFRFRRVPVFSVVTLRLPEGVKNAIRRIAMSCWSGPAVVVAGFGCAVVVTLMDSLCTGQVYVPILALLARETGSSRAFVLLVVYNLAFIAPLVAVFVLASKTTDAFQMAKWSSRNVIPAKIALGVLFALLGWLTWPRDSGDPESPPAGPVASDTVKEVKDGFVPGAVSKGSVGRADGRMSAVELAGGNERLNAMLSAPELDPEFPKTLASAVTDRSLDVQWRNHCLQFVPECLLRTDCSSADRMLLESVLERSYAERSTPLAGTALLGYSRLSERTGSPSREEVGAMAVALASDASSASENVVTALRVGTGLGDLAVLDPARYWARHGKGPFVRSVAISVIRDLGGKEDADFLKSLQPARSKGEERIITDGIRKLEVSE